jgi:hypothetical protein
MSFLKALLDARGALMLGALGVVFGDIGTSPIYAFRESIKAAGGDRATETTVFGVLSLVFWAGMPSSSWCRSGSNRATYSLSLVRELHH